MKKTALILAVLLLCVWLAGCGKTEAPDSGIRTVYSDGVAYTVDTGLCTVSDGEYTYRYSIGAAGMTFTYPDGETSTWGETGGVAYGTSSLNADFSKYADPMILADVIEEASGMSRSSGSDHTLLALVLIVIGAVDAVWPRKAWYLSSGWKYKDVEPSEMAVGMYRGCGIAAVVIGIILFIA